MRSANASATAPTTSVTPATTRRRRNASSGSVWSRSTGCTRAARKKARTSSRGLTTSAIATVTVGGGAVPAEAERRDRGEVAVAEALEDVALVRRDGLGQCVEGEPAQLGGLHGLPDGRRTHPGPALEEEVHPLLDRVRTALPAVQCGEGLEGGDRDLHTDLLAGLPDRGIHHRLPRLHVARDRRGPVPC